MDVPDSLEPPPADLRSILRLDTARRKPRLLLWLVGAGCLLALAAGTVVIYGNREPTTANYVLQPVVKRDITVLVNATGSVQPTDQVDVSSELSGTVRRVLVDYNSWVVKGQTLAELDTDKLTATVENSRAKLQVARAQLADAEATVTEKKLDLDRKQTLVAKGAGSVQDRDTAQAAYARSVAARENARASINAAEADLRLNELNLSKASITSPINGIVLKRNVDPGQTVASSLQAPVLFSLAEDLKHMEVQVDVDEADVGQVAEGQSATFQVDAYGERKFPATIRMVRFDSEVVQGVVTYKAVLSVANDDLALRPGMTATAAITVQKVAGALVVPNAALRFTPPAGSANPRSRSLISQLTFNMPRFRAPAAQMGPTDAHVIWVLRNGLPAAIPVTTGVSDGVGTEILSGDITSDQSVIVDTASVKR